MVGHVGRKKSLSICVGMECHFDFGKLSTSKSSQMKNFDQSANLDLSPQISTSIILYVSSKDLGAIIS